MMKELSDEEVARVVHEATAEINRITGGKRLPDWEDMSEIGRSSSINAVRFRRDNPDAEVSSEHERWVKEKIEAGWTKGERGEKTHPMLVPFDELPELERRKAALVVAIIDALI